MSDLAVFRRQVVRPTLFHLQAYHPKMWSPAAENLIMGTAAHESGGLKHLRQIGGGPALGVFQIEPATALDTWHSYLSLRPKLENLVSELMWPWPEATITNQLIWHPAYAAAVVRLIFWRDPHPLPEPDDILGLAQYWKRVYNSEKGKGTVKQFIRDYNLYVKE